MAQKRESEGKKATPETYQTDYLGHSIRIEGPRAAARAAAAEADAAAAETAAPRLFIDNDEVEVEHTEGGVIAHNDMAFKEYGSLEELAQDIIRQRGSAQIERSAPDDRPQPPHQPHR